MEDLGRRRRDELDKQVDHHSQAEPADELRWRRTSSKLEEGH
jgi:hypothetical protein